MKQELRRVQIAKGIEFIPCAPTIAINNVIILSIYTSLHLHGCINEKNPLHYEEVL